jgi:hypothetical protein
MTTAADPGPALTSGARLPHRPTFASALRQRGLLAKATMPESMTGAWSSESVTWIAVSSVYEAHLRRVLMEQALESLRADG